MNYDHFFADPLQRVREEQRHERLRITPTPLHDDQLIEALTEALTSVWRQLGLPLEGTARAAA